MQTRLFLWSEFFILFIAIPLAYYLGLRVIPPIPMLFLAGGYCILVLACTQKRTLLRMWRPAALRACIGSIVPLFLIVAATAAVAVLTYFPNDLFSFPMEQPTHWILVLILYPLFSALPQEIIYRGFFFARYQPLFTRTWAMIFASAATFAFSHIIFRNTLAVVLTLAGGVIFAYRYHKTGSLMLVTLEHALYGWAIFTLGLGDYFYHDSVIANGGSM